MDKKGSFLLDLTIRKHQHKKVSELSPEELDARSKKQTRRYLDRFRKRDVERIEQVEGQSIDSNLEIEDAEYFTRVKGYHQRHGFLTPLAVVRLGRMLKEK